MACAIVLAKPSSSGRYLRITASASLLFFFQFFLKIHEMYHPHSSEASFFLQCQVFRCRFQKLHSLSVKTERILQRVFHCLPASVSRHQALKRLLHEISLLFLLPLSLFLSDAVRNCFYDSICYCNGDPHLFYLRSPVTACPSELDTKE